MAKKGDGARRARANANGEGSIYQRADGRWCAAVTVGRTADGKVKRKVYYGATRAAVAAKMRGTQVEVDAGVYLEPSKVTLRAWCGTWIETYARPSRRTSTVAKYESCLRHVLDALGDLPLAKVQPHAVQSLFVELLKKLAPESVRLVHVALNLAMRQAVKNGLLRSNPIALVEGAARARKEFKVLEPAEMLKMLDAARGSEMFAPLFLEWATGLRRGELFGLRWSDVDFARGTVSVRQAYVSNGKDGGFRFDEPKTSASRRTIPIPPEVVAELRAHRARQLEARVAAGDGWSKLDLVFTGRAGAPVVVREFGKRFKRLLEAAELPVVRFHDLRHSHATMLFLLGEHPVTVQKRLGHSSISITLDIYTHVVPGVQERVASRLSGVLAGSEVVAVGQ